LFLRQLWILWPIYIYISHQQSIFFSIKHSVFSHRNQHLEKRTANIQPVFSLRHQTIPWVPRSLGGFHIRRSIALVKTVECVWNDKKVKPGVGQGTADILQKWFSKEITVSEMTRFSSSQTLRKTCLLLSGQLIQRALLLATGNCSFSSSSTD